MRLKVLIHPNSRMERVERHEGYMEVWIREPARRGKANKRLVEVVAEHFGIRRSKVRIVEGFTSREKVLEIDLKK